MGTGPAGRITKEDVEAHLAATEGEAGERLVGAGQTGGAPGAPFGFISPAVARLAAEFGVDLGQVVGTGAGGRITKKDVQAYIAAPVPRAGGKRSSPARHGRRAAGLGAAGQWFAVQAQRRNRRRLHRQPTVEAPAPVREMTPATSQDTDVVALSNVRRSIARHMVLSKHTSAHVTTVMEADVSRVVKAREQLRSDFARQGVRLTFTPFFIQAIIAGLRAVPEANSSLQVNAATGEPEQLLLHRRIHIGVAVAVEDGADRPRDPRCRREEPVGARP